MDDLKVNLPPIEIRVSDLNVSPRALNYDCAVCALKGYWSQATAMTKAEQEEYRDMLVTQKRYRGNHFYNKDYRLYQAIDNGRVTWPRWVFLVSLLGYVKELEYRIRPKFKNSTIEDLSAEYRQYFSTELSYVDPSLSSSNHDPELWDDEEYVSDDGGDEDEAHLQSEGHVKNQDSPKNDEAGKDNAAVENSKHVNHEQDTTSERPANPNQSTLEKQQRVDGTQALEQLLEQVVDKAANKAAQLVAPEMDKKLDGVLEAVKIWSTESAALIHTLNKCTEKLMEAMAEHQK
ncbi:hypothetical protein TrVGV298_002670 [Trichoderma virens]|nr:hypothetical protein TrVGV298_002670 [Trichoderma virens]UKZ74988.1 hypothetical protein TrVFT333_002659 [Trichoderma virens FT-333]